MSNREQETRLAAPRGCPRRAMLLVPVGRSPVACARSRRGRRVPAPTARAMGAGLPRPRSAPAFRVSKGHKKRASPHRPAHYPGANRPHQPSGGSEGSRALRMYSYRPASPGGRGVCAQAQTFLTRFPGRAEGAGETCNPGGKDRRQPSFSDARRQAGLFRRPTAVCRSSPRCPR